MTLRTGEQAQALLGLDASRPTVVRVGREDDRKWGDILVAMVPHLCTLVPEVQVVFVGATAHRRAQLRRAGVLEAWARAGSGTGTMACCVRCRGLLRGRPGDRLMLRRGLPALFGREERAG